MFWTLFFLTSSSYASQLKDPTCKNLGNSRTIRLSVNSTKSPTGVWMDGISAWLVMGNSVNATHIELAHTITECEGGRIFRIQGISPVPNYEERDDRLTFHPKCGKNVAVVNKGRKVQRIKIDEPNNSAVFTNRPLKDNEIFEIMIEGKNNKFKYAAGIGIMTKSPADVEILPDVHRSPYVWMYYDTSLYNNGKAVVLNIGKDIYKLQVGDTMGVMRSEMGTLHFFINGEDQGPAKSNVPPNVYGVLDLRQNYHKASIVL